MRWRLSNDARRGFLYEEYTFGELVPNDVGPEVDVTTYIPQRWGMYVPVRPGRELRLAGALRRLGRRKGYIVGGVRVDPPDWLRYPNHYAVSWMVVRRADLTPEQGRQLGILMDQETHWYPRIVGQSETQQ